MGRPTSPEQLCGLAFDLLRHSTSILSITTPESDEESLASRWYDAIRAAVLGTFTWSFARESTTIPLDPAGPSGDEYDSAYTLPSDYIGLIYVGTDIDDDYETDYAVEGRQILIDYDDADSLPICYIKDITDVSRFDPVFCQLLVGELAVVFGNAVTGLNKGIKTAEAFRDRWEAKARTKNSRTSPLYSRYKGILSNNRSKILGRTASSDGVHLF